MQSPISCSLQAVAGIQDRSLKHAHHGWDIQEHRGDVTGYAGQRGQSHIHQVDLQLRAIGGMKETQLQT